MSHYGSDPFKPESSGDPFEEPPSKRSSKLTMQQHMEYASKSGLQGVSPRVASLLYRHREDMEQMSFKGALAQSRLARRIEDPHRDVATDFIDDRARFEPSDEPGFRGDVSRASVPFAILPSDKTRTLDTAFADGQRHTATILPKKEHMKELIELLQSPTVSPEEKRLLKAKITHATAVYSGDAGTMPIFGNESQHQQMAAFSPEDTDTVTAKDVAHQMAKRDGYSPESIVARRKARCGSYAIPHRDGSEDVFGDGVSAHPDKVHDEVSVRVRPGGKTKTFSTPEFASTLTAEEFAEEADKARGRNAIRRMEAHDDLSELGDISLSEANRLGRSHR